MKSSFMSRTSIIFLTLFLGVQAICSAAAQAPCTISGVFDYSNAIEVVELTNQERAAKGLKPYIMDSTLMELAMIRAIEMKSIHNMTHTRPNGEDGPGIIWDTWGSIRLCRENIAYGYGSAQIVLVGWMNSPGHRVGILDKNCNRMGAGECDGYWVQLFAEYDKNSPVMAKSAKHIDEVTVKVAVSQNSTPFLYLPHTRMVWCFAPLKNTTLARLSVVSISKPPSTFQWTSDTFVLWMRKYGDCGLSCCRLTGCGTISV